MQETQNIPTAFRCPILKQVMSNPVLTIDGYTFEKDFIEEWINQGNNMNPLTGQRFEDETLIPNIALKSAIQQFMKEKKITIQPCSQKIEEAIYFHSKKYRNSLSPFYKMKKQKEEFIQKFKLWYAEFSVKVNQSGTSFENEEGEYEGQLMDGKPHGLGRFLFNNGEWYEGEWKDGKKCGLGEQFEVLVGIYKGYWQNDIMDGQGFFEDAHQNQYFGHVFDASKEGYGFFQQGTDDDIQYSYVGEYKDNFRHGKGRCLFSNGDIYDGDWEIDKPHGEGVMTYGNHAVYKGSFANGNHHGYGQYKSNNLLYEGEWAYGKKNGYGAESSCWANGNKDVYKGEFKNGQKHGLGLFHHGNGDIYKGQWRNDNKHGFGMYRFKNGETFEGSYADDQRNGFGVFKDATGNVFEADWKDGEKMGKGKFSVMHGNLKEEGEWNDDYLPIGLHMSDRAMEQMIMKSFEEDRKQIPPPIESSFEENEDSEQQSLQPKNSCRLS